MAVTFFLTFYLHQFYIFLQQFKISEFEIPLNDTFLSKFGSFFAVPKQVFMPLAIPNVGETKGWCMSFSIYLHVQKNKP